MVRRLALAAGLGAMASYTASALALAVGRTCGF